MNLTKLILSWPLIWNTVFPITGPLKGGLFIDLGNVWNLWDDIEDPKNEI
jgi:outer membrane protein assembly factor BamA